MAVRQDELSRLGSELSTRLAKNSVTTTTGNLALQYPLFKNTIEQVGSTINDVIDQINQDSIIDGIFNIIASDSRDPISKQFGPESSYLVDTMNHYINPQMPKGLFYGVEEDPVMWRLLHFMQNDPSDYPAFGANEDDALINTIEEMRLKMMMQATLSEHQADIYFNSHDNLTSPWWVLLPGAGFVTIPLATSKYKKGIIAQNVATSNSDAADMLSKANMLYKTILGSIDDSYVTIDTLSYVCKKMIRLTCPICPFFPPVYYNQYLNVVSPQQCDNSLPPAYVNNSVFTFDVINTTVTPITEETIYEIPSDATVLKPSQMAFPGCLDDYKRLLNERYNHSTGQFETIAVPKVNHLQVRNCEETEAAMRRLYEADDVVMPKFFKLEKK
jgi:hypothetical protein